MRITAIDETFCRPRSAGSHLAFNKVAAARLRTRLRRGRTTGHALNLGRAVVCEGGFQLARAVMLRTWKVRLLCST